MRRPTHSAPAGSVASLCRKPGPEPKPDLHRPELRYAYRAVCTPVTRASTRLVGTTRLLAIRAFPSDPEGLRVPVDRPGAEAGPRPFQLSVAQHRPNTSRLKYAIWMARDGGVGVVDARIAPAHCERGAVKRSGRATLRSARVSTAYSSARRLCASQVEVTALPWKRSNTRVRGVQVHAPLRSRRRGARRSNRSGSGVSRGSLHAVYQQRDVGGWRPHLYL